MGIGSNIEGQLWRPACTNDAQNRTGRRVYSKTAPQLCQMWTSAARTIRLQPVEIHLRLLRGHQEQLRLSRRENTRYTRALPHGTLDRGKTKYMANPLYDTLFGNHAGKADPFLHLPDGRHLSYQDFLELAARFANAMTGIGLRTGDRIAVQVEKSPEALALYAASAQAGPCLCSVAFVAGCGRLASSGPERDG